MLVGGYCRAKGLRERFDCSQTLVTECRRLIKENPERYGYYGTIGSLTSTVAFADAYKFRKELKEAKEIPPFDPEQAAKVVCVFDMMRYEKEGA